MTHIQMEILYYFVQYMKTDQVGAISLLETTAYVSIYRTTADNILNQYIKT